MIFFLSKMETFDFRRKTECKLCRKNLTNQINELKFNFVLFSMRSSFFYILCLSIPKNIYFFIKLQTKFFQNKNFVAKITSEIENFLTFHPYILPRIIFIENGIYQIFRSMRKTYEISDIYRENLRQKAGKSFEVPFQKNLAGKIFLQNKKQIN